MPSVFRRHRRGRDGAPVALPGWYFAYRQADGRRVVRRGLSSRRETLRVAIECEDKARRIRLGCGAAGFDSQRAACLDLPKMIELYAEGARAKGNEPRGIREMRQCLLRVRASTQAVRPEQWNAITVAGYLCELQRAGRSPATQCFYLQHIRGFLRWAVRTGLIEQDPLAGFCRARKVPELRRQRRALTSTEAEALLMHTPEPRRTVYWLAMRTGLRINEIRQLRWVDLRLGPDRCGVDCPARITKARRAAWLPLPDDLAAHLAVMRGQESSDGRAMTDTVFRTMPTLPTFRRDLTKAGVAVRDEQGRTLDRHSMRMTYITDLVRANTPPRVVQELARHSSIDLTMNIYTDPRILDLTGAVRALSSPADSRVGADVARKGG